MQANYYSTTAIPQRPPLGFDMNHLYLSPSHPQVNRPGIFHKRNEKIDWRRIAAVDVDRIAREMDFQALQDNLEQITLCNIDAEIDSRAMDPNFIKLYKMAQLTIEYLLVCQDQITTQLADYDQLKSKGFHEQKDAHDYIEKLKIELTETKKESKKRRKMLETQQRMLMAQNSNYHSCPVCTHAFLSAAYLQAHMQRRHPEYDPSRRREHDVDVEKEIHRLKDELNKKNNELQLVKGQKTLDEEKIRDRDGTIRQLKEDIHTLTTKMTILDDRYSHMRSNTHTRSPSPHRHEAGVSELLKENKDLRADIEKLKQQLSESENNLRKEEKLRKTYERELAIQKENLQLIQNTSGDGRRLTDELLTSQNRYNEEKLRRKKLEDELQQAKNQLAKYQTQQPPLPTRPNDSPVPTPVQPRPIRPIQTTEILLPEYCPSVVQRIRDNPKFLTKYRDEAKKQYTEELEEYESLGIAETDTRLTDLDFRTKMESVLQTRRNIQNDLPDFERIRANLTQTVDKIVSERLDVRRSITSIRSTGSKLVTFQDEQQRQKQPIRVYENTKKSTLDQQHRVPTTTSQAKPKYDHSRPTTNDESGEDVTISNANESDDDTQPTRPAISTDIRPSPRKNLPSTGINALASGSMRPSTASSGITVPRLEPPTIVRAKPTTDKFDSDSESEKLAPPPSTDKTRIIERKLQEANAKGQKPGISAIVRGIQPSQESLANKSDDDSESLTTLHTNPRTKPSNGHLPQLSGRESVNNNPLSSGDVSQHTYDSLWKSQVGKGVEFRRPTTADSAKTSNIDSDDNIDGEESN